MFSKNLSQSFIIPFFHFILFQISNIQKSSQNIKIKENVLFHIVFYTFNKTKITNWCTIYYIIKTVLNSSSSSSQLFCFFLFLLHSIFILFLFYICLLFILHLFPNSSEMNEEKKINSKNNNLFSIFEIKWKEKWTNWRKILQQQRIGNLNKLEKQNTNWDILTKQIFIFSHIFFFWNNKELKNKKKIWKITLK